MLPKTITRSALFVAAAAAFALPSAFAGPPSGDFWTQLNNTDGGGEIFHNVPELPKVPATPEQAANLRYLEAQRQISDGSSGSAPSVPDRAIVPATQEQAANLRYLECQRQISDGSGHTCGSQETSRVSASDAPAFHAGVGMQ